MNVLARDLWQEVAQAFRTDRGAAVADLWLRQTRAVQFARGVFTLGVPNEVVRDWLSDRYRVDLEQIFHRLTGSSVRVLVRVDRTLGRAPAERATEAPSGVGAGGGSGRLVVRPENRLAHAAVARLLNDPASGNPLFLYGPAGCGKTSLVRHHLERYAADHEGRRATVSVTAEAFSTGLVRAIREGTLSAFRGRMLAADAFVLEEAHRLRGKPRTQRELQSVLQYHVARGRPVLFTSRHPPNAIFLLDEGLRSHFLSGMLLRIADYAEASRAVVLEAVATHFARPVPRETLERIAHRVPGSFDRQVRFLEKVAAWASLNGAQATLDVLAERFPELGGDGARELDLDRLVELVAREFGTKAADVASNRKVRSAVLARHLVVYLATVVFDLKARRVMRHLGGLSPSTTAYARRKIEQKRKEDPVFDARVRRLLDELDRGQRLLF